MIVVNADICVHIFSQLNVVFNIWYASLHLLSPCDSMNPCFIHQWHQTQ